jgi:hypothetical protein
MNALLIVLIAFLIIIVITILVYYEPKYVNEMNYHLDELTGSTVGITRTSRDLLKPLEFKRMTSKPDEYIYSYDIPPSEHRRMLLITSYKDSRIFLNGAKQEEIMEKSKNRNTIATFLEGNQRDLRIVVISRNSKLPIMYMSVEEEPPEEQDESNPASASNSSTNNSTGSNNAPN